MPYSISKYFIILLCLYCTSAQSQSPYSGGGTTVFDSSVDAYTKPATNLSFYQRQNFFIGNSFFRNPWVIAPSLKTTARDGLGPLFNTNSCESCHVRDGRGLPHVRNNPLVALLVRLSVDSETNNDDDDKLIRHGVIADAAYGNQIQHRSIPGVIAEATVTLEWSETIINFPDGSSAQLRQPKIILSRLAYGELHEKVA